MRNFDTLKEAKDLYLFSSYEIHHLTSSGLSYVSAVNSRHVLEIGYPKSLLSSSPMHDGLLSDLHSTL